MRNDRAFYLRRWGVPLAAVAIGLAAGSVLAPGLKTAKVTLVDYWHDALSSARTITVPASGAAAAQKARFLPAAHVAPLVVDLHQWAQTEVGSSGDDQRLDELVSKRGWNYIRPALAGPNNSPAACCSDGVTDGLKAAVDYAIAHGRVDQRAIYVVGVSGGGYTALCAFHSGKIPVRRYIAWVPISDLEVWHDHHAFDKYGRDVRQCTASGPNILNVAEARRRSPIYMPLPAHVTPIHLYHGIRDGMVTSVSPDQSITWFNRLALQTGYSDRAVSESQRLSFLDRRSGSKPERRGSTGGRQVHFDRSAGPVRLTLFEGDHESFMVPTMAELEADYGALTGKRSR